jgi:hypothetical protein
MVVVAVAVAVAVAAAGLLAVVDDHRCFISRNKGPGTQILQ